MRNEDDDKQLNPYFGASIAFAALLAVLLTIYAVAALIVDQVGSC